MSHIKTIEDLNSSVGELASLMNETFTCCVRNYDALLPYIGKKETNFKIYHKLVQVNILLNKLSEELVGLRVEFVTVSSFEQTRETVLSEGDRNRRMSDVLGRHETKCIPMKVSFSNNSKCCLAVTSETGISVQSKNLVSVDSEETRHIQEQKKDIKREIQDSNEAEDFLVSPIDNSEIPAAQTLSETLNNGVTVSFSGNEKIETVADKLVRDSTCGKPSDTVTQRGNIEDCFPLQNFENKTNNHDKYEDTDNVLSKDYATDRGVGGKVDCTTSFSYQPRRLSSSEDSPFAFTTFNRESDCLLQGRSNKESRRAPILPIVCANDQNSKALCIAEDELYGVIRHHYQSGRPKDTLHSHQLVDYQAVHVNVKRKKRKRKRKAAKNNNNFPRVCEVSNDNSENVLVNYQAVDGNMKGKNYKKKRKTAKNSCAKESEITNNTTEWEITHNSCENKLGNYQAVHGHMKGKNYKKKRKTAKSSCAKESEITSNTTGWEITHNSCENKLGNYQVVHGHKKGKNYKKKRKTAKNSCAKEQKVTNNTYYQVVDGNKKGKNCKRKQKTAKNSCAKKSEITNNMTECKLM